MREHTRRISRRAFLGGAAAFGAVSLVHPALAFATPLSDKQAEADSVRSQVITMQQDLDRASDSYFKALGEHDQAVQAMDGAQARIDEANAKIESLQSKLGTRARSMYRSGSTSFFDILLGASTFEEFATSWDLLNDLNESDAAMVQQTKDLKVQVEAEKAEFARQEKIAAEKTVEAKKIKDQAEATVSQMQATLDSLDSQARTLLEREQRAAAEAAAAANQANFQNSGGGSSGGSSGGSGGTTIPAKGSVVDYAASRLGCPYVWGATGPDSFDCSGLTSWCYRQIGISITRTTESQYGAASAILPISQAQPGDVLYTYGHVGICTSSGGGQYIHAPPTRRCGEVLELGTILLRASILGR